MIKIWNSRTGKIREANAPPPGSALYLDPGEEVIEESYVFGPGIRDINALLDSLKRASDVGASEETKKAINQTIQGICRYITTPYIQHRPLSAK